MKTNNYSLQLLIILSIALIFFSSCDSDEDDKELIEKITVLDEKLEENLDITYTTYAIDDSLQLEWGFGSKQFNLDIDLDDTTDIKFELFGTQSHGIPSGYLSIECIHNTSLAKTTSIDSVWFEGGNSYQLDTFHIAKPFEIFDTLSINQEFTQSQVYISKLIGDQSSGGKYTKINNGFDHYFHLIFKKSINETEAYYGWIRLYQENNFNLKIKDVTISDTTLILSENIIIVQ